MFNWLLSVFSWLTSFWNKLSDEKKEKIINLIVDTFESMFRDFYHSEKRKSNV